MFAFVFVFMFVFVLMFMFLLVLPGTAESTDTRKELSVVRAVSLHLSREQAGM